MLLWKCFFNVPSIFHAHTFRSFAENVAFFSHLFWPTSLRFRSNRFFRFSAIVLCLSSEISLLLFLLPLIPLSKNGFPSWIYPRCSQQVQHWWWPWDTSWKCGLKWDVAVELLINWGINATTAVLSCFAGAQKLQRALCSSWCTTTPYPTIAAVFSLQFGPLYPWKRWSATRKHSPFTRLMRCCSPLHMCTSLACTCGTV